MTTPTLLLPLLLSALASWALAGLLSRGLGRLGWLDRPNARSSHAQPIPRGGGLAFIAPACLLLSSPWLLIPLPLALVGLIDDRRGLPVGLRLGVQLLTGMALAVQAGCSLPIALAAAVLAAAVINAINFMDGLDGLVAGCMLSWAVLGSLLLPALSLLPLAAGLLGFLVWNWSPARLFMGDVGSTYLGAVMAGGLLRAAHQGLVDREWGAFLALALGALPLLGDAFSCLLRRLVAGQPLWQAHRLHLYQRLQQAGWSHRRVAILYGLTSAGLSVLAGWVAISARSELPGFGTVILLVAGGMTIALGSVLDQRCAVPFETAVQLSGGS